MATDVVVDTNALLLPFTERTDIERELERLFGAVHLVVPSSVRLELEGLSRGEGKAARAAKAALRLLERCTVEPTRLAGDDGLLDVARRLGGIVVTNDKRLQAEAKRSRLRVVASRAKGRLHVLG